MRIAVINFSGNVGKTTVAQNLLAPRMGIASVISIESLNAGADAVEQERLRGRDFDIVQSRLLSNDTAIIDVGASNVEQFMQLMKINDGSHEDVDCFIVPVVRERKQQVDTVATIDSLNALGVPEEKIITVFNKLDPDENVESSFGPIIAFKKKQGGFSLNMEAVIYKNEVFERLRKLGTSLDSVVRDTTNYRALASNAENEVDKNRYIEMVITQRLAKSAQRNLDEVYEALFGVP